jgi:hypothetical protein
MTRRSALILPDASTGHPLPAKTPNDSACAVALPMGPRNRMDGSTPAKHPGQWHDIRGIFRSCTTLQHGILEKSGDAGPWLRLSPSNI